MTEKYPGKPVETYVADITSRESLEKVRDDLLAKYGHIDGLINNAANNPKMEGGSKIWEPSSSIICRFPCGRMI